MAGIRPVLAGEPWQIDGFYETRFGLRTHDEKLQSPDMPVGEGRIQLDCQKDLPGIDGELKYKVDAYYDLVTDDFVTDPRMAYLSFSTGGNLDVKVGRQVLTWGTGDLLFINDLFPKDWVSFFIGRDQEYLKAPSDAVKLAFYGNRMNVDVVYTPRFDPDRAITGERVSYFSSSLGRIAGQDAVIDEILPDDWFEDDELAVRLHTNRNGRESAFYYYHGFWKTPQGMDAVSGRPTHPRLAVYGASLRRPVGRGIGNVELGYYDSLDDSSGRDPMVRNSEFRLLLGYEFQPAGDDTLAFQAYLERMSDYGDYIANSSGPALKDRNRLVLTTRFTRLRRMQTDTWSLFAYYSPTDHDGYIRPLFSRKLTDQVRVDIGANIFFGREDYTFFGQFEGAGNVYVAWRRSF